MWRSDKHRKWVVEGTRFTLTVIASSLLAIWLPHQWRNLVRALERANRSEASSSAPGENNQSLLPAEARRPVPVGKMEDLYRKHLEEIFRTLEARQSVKIIRMRLPVSILKYQQNAANPKNEKGVLLQGVSFQVPIAAVPISAKSFLEQMLVTYIDPQKLPSEYIPEQMLPFKEALIGNFVLVPDLTGDNAAYFSFDSKDDE